MDEWYELGSTTVSHGYAFRMHGAAGTHTVHSVLTAAIGVRGFHRVVEEISYVFVMSMVDI
jgi:hypothetical protein